LDSFLDSLKQDGDIDITQNILSTLQANQETIQKLFLDSIKTLQIVIFRDCLGNNLPSITESQLKEIYDSLQSGIDIDETTFIKHARSAVNEYWSQSLAVQVKKLWKEKTDTNSPNDWTALNHMPVKMLFAEYPVIATEIQTAIEKPSEFSTEKLKTIQEKLQNWTLPEIDDVQRKIGVAEQRIDAMSGEEAKKILRKLLQKESVLLLEILGEGRE
jgi:hypothetical protein